MKMIKKITSVFMTFLVMAALVIGSTSVAFAADKVDDTVKSTLVTTAEGLTDAIVQLKDEEIENYMSSGDDFTTSAILPSLPELLPLPSLHPGSGHPLSLCAFPASH